MRSLNLPFALLKFVMQCTSSVCPKYRCTICPYQVDASAGVAGAAQLQADDAGIEHPISYFAKKFTKCQQNYRTIEKLELALF